MPGMIKNFYYFLKDILTSRQMLSKLVKNDLKTRYAGSAFGIIWAYIQPLINILVFWFVFQVGFRNPPVENIEFILWFIAANIPWIYFNDCVTSSANCLYEYSYLVKKMRFRTSVLPIVKVMSATYIHMFFIFFVFFMYEIYGYAFQWIWLQSLYYSFSVFCLSVGISWIVSSISVFFKDFSQIVSIVMQILFWLTPIFWSPDSISPNMLTFFKLNPMYYIVNGYRDSFIYGVPFWHHGALTIYFWAVVVIVFIAGAVLYQRLRPHFADIL